MSSSSRSADTPRARRRPTVDVVVPCYNYGHFLPDCIASVTSQDGIDVRVLVIDDASTDDSAHVAERIAADDARVAVVVHRRNRGHIATYNEGLIDWADRDYVVLLSADDRLAPGALRRATDVMEANPRVGMVYGHAPYFEHDADLGVPRSTRRSPITWSGRHWVDQRCRRGVNVISSPEVVCRTSVQHHVGGYAPTLPHVGDLEMWLRMAAVSDIAYVRSAPQAFYRVHGASMQRTTFAAHLDDLRQRRDGFDHFFAHEGSLLAGHDRMHDAARRALAGEALWRAGRAIERDQVGEVPVEDLVEFARSCVPDVERTAAFRRYQRRRTLGPRFCRTTRVFVMTGAIHRLGSTYRSARWKRRGT
jgi:hypothetical protein